MSEPERLELCGLVESLSYHNADNGFFVARVRRAPDGSQVKVVGSFAQMAEGVSIRAVGWFERDERFGAQFRAETISVELPRDRGAVVRYLSSGILPGVGKGLAEKIVNATWPDTFEALDRLPGRIEHIRNIGESRGRRIVAAWKRHRAVEGVVDKLRSYGITHGLAERIFRKYRDKALEVVQNEPYRLVEDVRGIGFQRADAIARSFGIAADSPLRLQSGVQHAVSAVCHRHGHTAVPRSRVLQSAAKLLGIDSRLAEPALNAVLASRQLVEDGVGSTGIYLPPLHRAETGIVTELTRLLRAPRAIGDIAADRAVSWAEKRTGLNVSRSQRAAAETSLSSKISIVTGGPGTGKTTLVRLLLEVLQARGARVRLCAPTGRAARRLSQATGLPATTVHRLLLFDPATGGFEYGSSRPLEGDVFLMDEWSMADLQLTHALLRAIPSSAMAILVGDVDQLPSIAPGNVLADLIDAGLPTGRLSSNEVFRQSRDSGILEAADAIRRGAMPALSDRLQDDFVFLERRGEAAIRDTMVQLVAEQLPSILGVDALRDIQVLTPFNRDPLGTESLNEILRRVLLGDDRPGISRGDVTFRVGDKVIQIENNYQREVFNGDIGFVDSVDSDENTIDVVLEGQQRVRYGRDELDELKHATAITVHRSQGSEYPVVVMPVMSAHSILLTRPLVYTAVTRGKVKVVYVGETRALESAVRNRLSGEPRQGYLCPRMAAVLNNRS